MELEAIRPCRTCMELAPDQTSIFSVEIGLTAALQLEYCAGVVVQEEDGLPAGICSRCLLDLRRAYLFVRKCRCSERRLYSALGLEHSPAYIDRDDDHSVKHEKESNDRLDCENDCQDAQIDNVDKSDNENSLSKRKDKFRITKKCKSKSKGNNRRICDTCGATAASRAALAVHARTHSGERPYVCHHCGGRFTQKSTLRTHLMRRHSASRPAPEKRFACEECGKRYSTSTNLKIHVRTHTHERPFACKLCPARFTQVGPLQAHSRRHTGDKPHACALCDKRFSDRTHLLRHRSVHSEERPFACTLCPVRLKSRYSLKVHVARHSGARTHVCDACGVAFATVWSLNVHTRKLHSERSGLCATCEKPVADLAEHASLHSGERRHACAHCDARFTSRRGLAVHARRHLSPLFSRAEGSALMHNSKQSISDVNI